MFLVHRKRFNYRFV